ncbi:MAG TPA: phage tail sheath subtilisin-like domain-containing protein [Chloroflexia bacterium]|jgi:hypothetical protein
MPEYLAPGVYVEEVSFRARSIEGVGTTTTGFIGPAGYGPLNLEPEIVTSLDEFERTYGGGARLRFREPNGDPGLEMDNYVWHAVRAFFAQGGTRLYISRVFRPFAEGEEGNDGHASAFVPDIDTPVAAADGITIRARFPGEAGNMRVRFTLRLGQSVLSSRSGAFTVSSMTENEVVFIGDMVSPLTSPPGGPIIVGSSPPVIGAFYLARRIEVAGAPTWEFVGDDGGTLALSVLDPAQGVVIMPASVTVTIRPVTGPTQVYESLALDPAHERGGLRDSIFDTFEESPVNLASARGLPIIITAGDNVETGLDVIQALLLARPDMLVDIINIKSSDDERSLDIVLEGGNDGARPTSVEYEGEIDDVTNLKTGLQAFEDLEDIAIVAAPGHTFGYEQGAQADVLTIMSLLMAHAARMKYRIVVLESANGQAISQVRAMRAQINSKYAAFYYPWVRVLDPITRKEIHLPPSGFVAGIYARNDITRAVFKAPANEVVTLAIGFEKLLNKAQQEVLNPEAINCFRFFEGRGYLLWGARMATDDTDFKYVNLRRYFAYLERSIDRGTQFAVFEPNGPDLWASMRRTIESFLLNEWVGGALLGDKPEKAFFVRCDRSTMTQNDLDNGRMICLIGIAPVRPAEFVIFRIGQFTADKP